MVIYCVSIVSKTGQILLSRQYTHESRSYTDGILSAFPQLVVNAANNYIETETTRFVYQEIDSVFIVLLVSKDSNIIEDLETLKLLVELTRLSLPITTNTNMIDLILFYDEVVFDGLRRKISFQDVHIASKMVSRAEEQYNLMLEQKIEEERKRRAKLAETISSTSSASVTNAPSIDKDNPMMYNYEYTEAENQRNAIKANIISSQAKGSGMILGKNVNSVKNKAKMVFEEIGLSVSETAVDEKNATEITGNFNIFINERFSATLSHDNMNKSVLCEGRLFCKAFSDLSAIIKVKLGGNEGFQTRPLQQPDRKLFLSEKKLIYDNTTGSYVSGTDVPLFGWKKSSSSDKDLPFSFSIWTNKTNDSVSFTCDISLSKDNIVFDDLCLDIPLGQKYEAKVERADGEHSITLVPSVGYILRWKTPQISSETPDASIEFVVEDIQEEDLFPINVSFNTQTLLFDIDIESVCTKNGSETPYVVKRVCNSNNFVIE